MAKDEFLSGPSPLHVKMIQDSLVGDLEPEGRKPLLALAREQAVWFRYLLPKCNPAVTWIEGGQEASLGTYLYGRPTYNMWVPYMIKWEEDHRSIDNTLSPTTVSYDDDPSSLDMRPVAAALGIAVATLVAAPSLGVGLAAIPAVAGGSLIWKCCAQAIGRWHRGFSIKITPNQQRLRTAFGNLTKSVGGTVLDLKRKIEEAHSRLSTDPESAEAEVGRLNQRVELLQAVLNDEVSRVEGPSTCEENEMMTRIKNLFDFQRRLQIDLRSQEMAEDLRSVVGALGRIEDLLHGQGLCSQFPAHGTPRLTLTPRLSPRVNGSGAPSSHKSTAAGSRFSQDDMVSP
eukprot:g10900.t1